uniref:Uncharacterized protein n=1 Tax=Nothobranchius furzeri TaxID=105023 RepID=A0A8C6VWP8_NOTFU
IPIWSMTCCQLWEEPCFFKPATSCSLILMMRLAIPWTSSNLQSGVFRMVEAILAPFTDSTLFASSASLHTTVKPPTRSPVRVEMNEPIFLWRTAQASRSMSPLAKP